MHYQALLFDMDGVVIDTHESVTRFWLELAEEYNVQLTAEDFARHIYGCPLRQTLDICFPNLTADQRAAIHYHMVEYETNLVYREVPGVTALLRTLKQNYIPTALVTSGEPHKVQTVLSQLELTGIFTNIVTAVDITHGKPDPEGYLLAAQRLSQSSERCVVFEDSMAGIMAGVAAGASCVGIDSSWGNRDGLLQAGASYIISNFSEVRLDEVEPGHLNLHLDQINCLSLR
jgi:HAD superfamily hydrolase (TIGR01509 family)